MGKHKDALTPGITLYDTVVSSYFSELVLEQARKAVPDDMPKEEFDRLPEEDKRHRKHTLTDAQALYFIEHAKEILEKNNADIFEYTYKYPTAQINEFCLKLNPDYRRLTVREQIAKEVLGERLRAAACNYYSEKEFMLAVCNNGAVSLQRPEQIMIDLSYSPENLAHSKDIAAKLTSGTLAEKRAVYQDFFNRIGNLDLTGLDPTDDENVVNNFDRYKTLLAVGPELKNLLGLAADLGIEYTKEEDKPFIAKLGMVADIAYMARCKVNMITHPVYSQIRFEDLPENFDKTQIFDSEGEEIYLDEFFEERNIEHNRAAESAIEHYGNVMTLQKEKSPILFNQDAELEQRTADYLEHYWDNTPEVVPVESKFTYDEESNELIPKEYGDFATDEELEGIEAEKTDNLVERLIDENVFGEVDDGKDEYRREMEKNLSLIREVIPDFELSFNQQEKYYSDHRIELKQRIDAYEADHAAVHDQLTEKRIAETFRRNAYTFFKKGTKLSEADIEANEKILNSISDPSEAGEELRKNMFIDSLNKLQYLDMSKLVPGADTDGALDYTMDNIDLLERGFEWQKSNREKTNSLGFAFAPEEDANLKKIENKSVLVGGLGYAYSSIMKSPLFLTFPFTDITQEQAMLLVNALPKVMKRLGYSIPEQQQYIQLLQSSIGMSMERNYAEPEKKQYTVNDIIDKKPSFNEAKEKMFSLSRQMLEASSLDEISGNNKYAQMVSALYAVINEMESVDGPVTAQKAAAIHMAGLNLAAKTIAFDGSTSDQVKINLGKELQSLIDMTMTSDQFFETLICKNNKEYGVSYDPKLFEQMRKTEDVLRSQELNAYSDLLDKAQAENKTVDEYISKVTADDYVNTFAYRAEFRKNIALIQELIPGFEFSEEDIDKYITPERLELHRRALEYSNSIDRLNKEAEPYPIPTSYTRSLYTFLDKNPGPDAAERNAEIMHSIGAPTPEGELLRKQLFVDTLNEIQTIDASKFGPGVSFEEKADYVLSHADILERGFEFQNSNASKEASLGISFSEEENANIKNLEDKAVETGGIASNLRRLCASDLFLTFPFDRLTEAQAAKLTLELQSHLMHKGMSFADSSKYTGFMSDIFYSTSKTLTYTEPEARNYTLNDVVDIKPSMAGLKSEFARFHKELQDISERNVIAKDPSLARMMEALRQANIGLSYVNGPVSPAQAACLKMLVRDVYTSAETFAARRIKVGTGSDFDIIRKDIAQNIKSFIGDSGKNNLLFETLISRHNTQLGGNAEPAFLTEFENISNKMEDSGVSYSAIQDLAADLGLTTEEFVSKAADGSVKWKMEKWEINKFRADNQRKISEERLNQLIQKYELSDYEINVFRFAEMSDEELCQLPFMQNKTADEQKKALHEYLEKGRGITLNNLPKEYADTLLEAGMNISDVKIFALRQGISVENYLDLLMGKIQPELNLGGNAAEAENRAKTEDEQIRDALTQINKTLRSSAKNPLESFMAETMIDMKELSFGTKKLPGGGTEIFSRAKMEKSVAKYIALKTIQEHEKIKNGEVLDDTEEGIVKSVRVSKQLAKLNNYTDDVYSDNTFRYFISKIKTEDLIMLSRGDSLEPLNSCYDEMHKMMQEKSIHRDYQVALDRRLTLSAKAYSKESFFSSDLIDTRGEIRVVPNNPFKITIARGGLVALTIGNMLKKNHTLDEILDPYMLQQVKRQIGSDTYKQVQTDTPENRQAVIDSYMTLMEKGLGYANVQMSRLASLNPIDIVKLNDMSFFAVGNMLQDAFQELGTMNKQQAFPPETAKKFKELSEEVGAINKIFDDVKLACKAVNDFGSDPQREYFGKNMARMLSNAYMNKAFIHTKQRAAQNNVTISQQMKIDEASLGPSLDTMTGVHFAVDKFVSMKYPDRTAEKFNNSAELRNQICQDVFFGKIEKKLVTGLDAQGNSVISLNKDYLNKFIEAPQKTQAGGLAK